LAFITAPVTRKADVQRIAGLAILVTTLLVTAAQPSFAKASETPWTRVPSVTALIGRSDDRADLLRDAVEFWNQTFAKIGSPFRLGVMTHMYGAIPVGELVELSKEVRSPTAPDFSSAIRRWPGNIIVALSKGPFISFTARWPKRQKVLIGIRNLKGPLALPNVARNVIARELGHAIGLKHNNAAGTLMCGIPAPCRPDAFASGTPHYFPLTQSEKAELTRMYPATWKGQ
jgi:hypothetical protein